jgi:hypothetical protein
LLNHRRKCRQNQHVPLWQAANRFPTGISAEPMALRGRTLPPRDTQAVVLPIG